MAKAAIGILLLLFSIVVFKVIRRLILEYRKPIPMNVFNDYNEYWSGGHVGSSLRGELIGQLIEHDTTVLDIGCGDGNLITAIKKHKTIQETGIDISEVAVLKAQQKGVNALQLDITKTEITDKYDYIIISEVLEHIPNPEVIVNQIKNKFNKELIITLPNAGYIWYRLRLLCGKFPIVLIVYYMGEHLRFWTVKDFKEWLAHFDLIVEQIISIKGDAFGFGSFRFNLHKRWPHLFSSQIIYVIRKEHIDEK